MTDTLASPESLPKRRDITVHFDGSCLGNPGPGGFAAILVNTETGNRKIVKGPVEDGSSGSTTNNRAELTAAIRALEAIRSGAFVTMVGDSQIVINGMTTWRYNWQRQNWRGKDKKQVSNLDLWFQLFELAEKPARLEWVWAKGHAGNELNEEADRFAKAEAKKLQRSIVRR